MPKLWRAGGGELPPPGGIEVYPIGRLYEEVAFVAYYFHWGYEQIMTMPHGERRIWCEEISKINKKLTEEANK
jgi:hypothetical protein